jgi:sterol desaturase/sphingolipid hydroxylase (fatty acid hydroxylase superfamily)
MAHVEIVKDKEPIRLFESNFLEFFSHVSPVTVLVIWLPVAAFFVARAVSTAPAGASVWHIPAGVVIGLAFWTIAEYMLHRFLFHFAPRNAWQERISFLFHGVHHAQPQCKTRLVMPPAVSIPLAAVFYGLFWLIVGVIIGAPQWVAPLFAGFILGYIAYDMTHYSTHHFPVRGYFRFLKIYHMNHHYKTPDMKFGVTSPVWDRVFGTLPPS